jgi:cytochrome c-type biogenesis protein CcmF
MVPVFLIVLLLMGVGYLVPWRKANREKLGRRLLVPVVVGIAGAALLATIFGPVHWTGPVALGLVLLALTSHLTDYARAVGVRRAQHNEPVARAMVRTVTGNRRHYGGMVVHMGILVIALGLMGSGLFRLERAVTMAPGDVLEIGAEKLRFDGVRQFREANYVAIQARFTLLNSGRAVFPERRRYPRQEAPMTETGIDSTPLRDVYAVLADPAPDERWGVHVYLNPLVQFIWIGGGIVLLGLTLTLSGRRRARAPAIVAVAPEPAK